LAKAGAAAGPHALRKAFSYVVHAVGPFCRPLVCLFGFGLAVGALVGKQELLLGPTPWEEALGLTPAMLDGGAADKAAQKHNTIVTSTGRRIKVCCQLCSGPLCRFWDLSMGFGACC
jgi:hypothetical protein